jgi:hypothetical protein
MFWGLATPSIKSASGLAAAVRPATSSARDNIFRSTNIDSAYPCDYYYFFHAKNKQTKSIIEGIEIDGGSIKHGSAIDVL